MVDMHDWLAPLGKQDVAAAIDRRRPRRVPLIQNKWWGEGLREQYGARLEQFDNYPTDAVMTLLNPAPVDQMDLSWRRGCRHENQAHDAGGILPDWRHLDEFIDKLPDPDAPGLFDGIREQIDLAHARDRYVLFGWWRLFFERPWMLRGMENLMVDYYEAPEQVHRLHDALCRHYVAHIRRAAKELRPDGFWTSDDLGHQTQLMMSPDTFREFLKPYYIRVGQACRDAGMHFWLHSCGNNTPILGDLADVGVQVFHPVQKHTMDERAVAREHGGRLTFLAGFDVQHILQEGTPEDVRAEVRHLIDTFDRPDGGMCLAAGNGIVSGTPFENIEAFLDEAARYGWEHRAGFA